MKEDEFLDKFNKGLSIIHEAIEELTSGEIDTNIQSYRVYQLQNRYRYLDKIYSEVIHDE